MDATLHNRNTYLDPQYYDEYIELRINEIEENIKGTKKVIIFSGPFFSGPIFFGGLVGADDCDLILKQKWGRIRPLFVAFSLLQVGILLSQVF